MDTGTLILIAIIVIAVVLLIKRLMPSQSPYSQQGPNRPQYNDPNISSHGGFGGNQQPQQGNNRPQYDDPNIESHGGFGSSGESASKLDQLAQGRKKYPTEASSQNVVEREPENGRQHDDQNVSSHGGFGGQK